MPHTTPLRDEPVPTFHANKAYVVDGAPGTTTTEYRSRRRWRDDFDKISGRRTFFTGVFAGGAMLSLLWLAWFFLQANVPLAVAGALGLPATTGNFVFAMIVMLVGYGVVALAYAWGFERLRRANALIGAGFGVVHGLLAVALLALVMWLHPAYPTVADAPGLWHIGLGWWGLLTFGALHIVYGAIVGAIVETRATTRRASSEVARPNVSRIRPSRPLAPTLVEPSRQPTHPGGPMSAR